MTFTEGRIPNDGDTDIFKDDPEQLWLFASALLAASLRGTLAKLPSARILSTACANIMKEIERATEERNTP